MQRLGEHAFFGLPIVTTFSLGVWQVYRLDRKKGMIEARAARLSAPSLSVSELCESKEIAANENRRITISGTFLHDKEMLVGPRSAPKDLPPPVLQWAGSSGFLVVTPLVPDTEHSNPLLVVRGWVPQRLADRAARVGAAVTPAQFIPESATRHATAGALPGIVRAPVEERNRFTPSNNARSGDWYYIDSHAMLPDLDERPPVVELVQPLSGNGWPYPKAQATALEFRTPPATHNVYATTWFSLSAALALLTRARYRRLARGRNPKNAAPS